MIKTRIMSAAIAVALFAGTLYFGKELGMAAVAWVVGVLGFFEFSGLVFPATVRQKIKVPFIVLGILQLSVLLYEPRLITVALSVNSILIFAACLILARDESIPLKDLVDSVGLSIFGFLYVGLAPFFFYRLTLIDPTFGWLFFTALVVFSGDIAAYFIGSKFGKTKLFPRISPNKSIEGAIAGVFASVAVGVIYKYFVLPEANMGFVFLLSAVTAVAAQAGDFCESMLKRACNKKDSGALMPGHGGILDRLDGTFFAAPIVYAFLMTVGGS